MVLNFALVILGIAMLVLGGDKLVEGATHIGKRFGMSDRVAGLTICAVGTSMPEVFVSVTSTLSGNSGMAVGNIMGSDMANLLLILGVSAIIVPLNLAHRTTRVEVPMSIGAVLVFALFANTDNSINAIEGAILLTLFVLFIANSVIAGMREVEDEGESPAQDEDTGNISKDVLFIVIAIGLLKMGADLVVDNAVAIASALGVSQVLISLTIVSVGTALPELVTSSVAAFKGNADTAVGNVMGSVITNLLLVAGAPALFAPLAFNPVYNLDLALIAIFSVCMVVFTFVGRTRTFSRRCGLVFVMFYIIYLASAVIR
ncbi:calcium/sodium antiporter [Collinsella phocaeensis]|uniref:calcium/sodium antiporter n=1 Tax=Collinsella phocaeensis TaxID=1871016 RepID=UPI000931C17B|nr:calcium/sodium antiporter [Collinsella phocaeensis]